MDVVSCSMMGNRSEIRNAGAGTLHLLKVSIVACSRYSPMQRDGVRKCSIVLLAIVLGSAHAPGQLCKPTLQYFPESSLELRKDHTDWYSCELQVLEEPSLYQLRKSPMAESYRFLWLRTFHHQIAVRLDVEPDGTAVLTKRAASGSGGFRPGVLSETSSRSLTREQTSAFLAKVNEVKFWEVPNPIDDRSGLDGSQWVIEGVKSGRYHVIDRWTPTSGAARQLGSMLAFDLAKINIPKSEIY